ncbi:MAG: hypothetical protein GTN49_04025 [candidate division Zixibacteria bacterium]|nr:hypothetical protein [candidate division Zixibacteria bacterium]
MKYRVVALSLLVCVASLSTAAEVRIRYSNGIYNSRFFWIQYAHPGTLCTPSAGQYPVLLKTAHFGFEVGNAEVRVKIWSATGSTPGTVLASFYILTDPWPRWTDVSLEESKIIVNANNFFISSDTLWREFFVTFRGAMPRQYPGHHFTSQDDIKWVEAYADWAIECTVDTNYGIGVAPASLGRVKALYR